MLTKLNLNETTHHPGIFMGNISETRLLRLVMAVFASFSPGIFLESNKNKPGALKGITGIFH